MKQKMLGVFLLGIAVHIGVIAAVAVTVYTTVGGLGGIIAAIGASLVTVKIMNKTLTPISKALAPKARRP